MGVTSQLVEFDRFGIGVAHRFLREAYSLKVIISRGKLLFPGCGFFQYAVLKVLQGAVLAERPVARYVLPQPGFFIIGDVFSQPLFHDVFLAAQCIKFIRADIRLSDVVYVFRLIDHNGFGKIQPAASLFICPQNVAVSDVRAQRNGKGMTIDLNENLDVWPVYFLLDLFAVGKVAIKLLG